MSLNESGIRLAEPVGYDSPGRDETSLELRHYAHVLWRRKIVAFFTSAVIIVAGGAYTYLQTPVYRSTAEVLLQPSFSEVIADPDFPTARGGDAARSQVETEVEVLRSQSVQEAVADRVGQLPMVTISQRGESGVVAVTATSSAPEDAARIAQTYADTYLEIRRERLRADLEGAIAQIQAQIDPISDQLAELERPIIALNDRIPAAPDETTLRRLQDQRNELIRQTDGQRALLQSRERSYSAQLDRLRLASSMSQTGGATLVTEAEVPTDPSSPSLGRNLLVTIALSMLLGVVAAFLHEHADDAVKGEDDLEQATPHLPVLGLIPTVRSWRRRDEAVLISLTAPASSTAEAYRTLRTSLQLGGSARPGGGLAFGGLIQVTSPNHGEGRTTTACNLAFSLARAGHRVIVVDCDLRRPRLHEFFDLGNDVGLATALATDTALASAVQLVPGEPRLAVVAAGPPPLDPSELLSSQRCRQILETLGAEADFVLVDGPPVLASADAMVLAHLVDAVIMVVAANITTRGSINRATELLERIDAPLIGNVLNRSS